MTDTPDDRRYTKEHEWARADGDRVIVGITDFAQDQLGDIVFVGLPDPGTEVHAGQPMGEVESTKSVSDVFSPVSGTVAEKNTQLDQSPELVNSDPYGDGWLVAIQADASALDSLMSASEYTSTLAGGEH